ncbi:MAG: glutamine synthetase family protein [Pseudomonadota bacterium]|nr:glutamine synthetase family protein [Pseudomonadota bacterium]
MKDLQTWLAARDIESVECLVPDFQGVSRGKVVPVDEFNAGNVRLPESIFGQDAVGGWCEDYEIVDITDVDMVLIPLAETLVEQPWSSGRTAQCICDCQTLAGARLPMAPRTVLQNVIERYRTLGLQPIVAQEAEFYLVSPNPDPNEPIRPPSGTNGRTHTVPRSYQTEVLGEFRPFLDRLKNYTDIQNVETTTLVQEMGTGQLEVNFKHGDALARADAAFLFKRLVRQAAYDEGLYATFLAKPMTGEPGSAMHLHQSLVHVDSGTNAFVDRDGKPNDLFFAFIAGLQKYAPAMMPFFAPSPNSYRRFLDPDTCPTKTEWGYDNRTTAFRVPNASPEATRVENRIPGADTNPYLAIAASLASGYLGIEEKLKPTKPTDASAWDLDPTLPRSMDSALQGLLASETVRNLLGEDFVVLYNDVKRREDEAFQRTVTAWEREYLMLTA